MNTLVAAISAVAAIVAATLAALNLYVSGRREQTKWAREALVDVLVAFLDASFRSKDAVKRAIRQVGSEAIDEMSASPYAEEARTAEREMRVMQTRLRLLASPNVVDSAQGLRLATREYIALLDTNYAIASTEDRNMRSNLWHLRQDFIDESKVALSLPRQWLRRPTTVRSLVN